MCAAKRLGSLQKSGSPAPAMDATALLDATFTAMRDPLVVVDGTGRIVRTNAAYRRMLSADEKDAFYTATLQERMRQIAIADAAGQPLTPEHWPISRVLRGESIIGEDAQDVLIQTRDGRHLRLNPRGNPLRDAQGAIIGGVVIYHDVTAQRQAEAAHAAALAQVEAERQQLMTLLDVLPAGVAIYDAQGHLVQQNAMATRLTMRSPDPGEVADERQARYGMRRPDGTPMPEPETPSGRARRGQSFTDLTCVIAGADGGDVTLLTSGAPLPGTQHGNDGAVVVFQDVTARRVLERRTHISLDALLSMAQSAVSAKGDIRSAARGIAQVTCDVLGCQRVGVMAIETDTAIIRPLAVVGLAPEEEKQWWAMQPDNARYGEGGDPDQLARFAAGEEIILDMTAPPLDQQPNPFGITTALFVPMRLDDQLVGFISLDHAGTRHDYTRAEITLAHGVADLAALVVERERLQAANAAAQARVLALDEINTRMNTFLGIAGHELRTPITSIKTSVQLATRAVQQAQGIALPAPLDTRMDRAAHLLQSVNSQTDKLNRFIGDLLDVTRIQSGTMTLSLSPIDLAKVTREAIDTLRIAWSRRSLQVDVPTAEIRVNGDGDRLGQVVTNLVINALKYSDADQPVAVRLLVSEHLARLEVRDHGPGLTATQQTQLFQAFGRVAGIEPQSGAGVGLGLGLYICKTIVEQHDGQLGVISQPGAGATFWVVLPLVAGD